MPTLMPAPEECASWEWELDGFAPPGLESALRTAALMSAVLREHELFGPSSLEWNWFVYGVGGIGIATRLSVMGRLDEADPAQPIQQSRPVGFPDAEVGAIVLSGTGKWIDAEDANTASAISSHWPSRPIRAISRRKSPCSMTSGATSTSMVTLIRTSRSGTLHAWPRLSRLSTPCSARRPNPAMRRTSGGPRDTASKCPT